MPFERYNLNLAGEYRVAAELLLRGLFATVTYGNKKGADVIAIGENRRAAVIEVKASQQNRFVTKFYQKYANPDLPRPDFWVLYSVASRDNGLFEERFFILSDQEMAVAQAERNCPGEKLSYDKNVARVKGGVDNVILRDVAHFENDWSKIVEFCNGVKRDASPAKAARDDTQTAATNKRMNGSGG